MTLYTSDDKDLREDDLLRSFHRSIRELRKVIEDLKEQIRAGEEVDLTVASKALAPAETLIRNCQKWEASLAEQKNRDLGIARGGYAIDLDAARFEVGCRLARLRAHRNSRDVPV